MTRQDEATHVRRRSGPRWLPSLGAIAIAAAAIVALDRLPRVGTASATPTPRTSEQPPASSMTAVSTPTAVPDGAPTEPPEPTNDPLSVAACTIEDLAMTAGGWGGATGSEAGGATLINVSSDRCRVQGKPELALYGKGGDAIASGDAATDGEPVVLLPGSVTGVITVWQNWCAEQPARPLSLEMSLFGIEGVLRAEVTPWKLSGPNSVPRCALETAPSTIGVPLPFAAAGPPEGAEPGVGGAACSADVLRAFRGGWGAAAGTSYTSVVVLNTGDVGCLLDVAPALELRDGDGQLLEHAPSDWPPGTIDLPAGRAAQAYLGFADMCLADPKLPFEFDLVVDGAPKVITPTSDRSMIGAPACQSDPPSAAPALFLNDPFALPEDAG